MESNRCLVFFLFGLSILPKIYSDDFPSLILVKSRNFYYSGYRPADEIEYAGDGNNLVKFVTPSNNLSTYHNACPRENELLHWTNALEVKGEMTDLQPTTLEWFVKGLFDKYDCKREIKPITLKYEAVVKDESVPVEFERYHIGFVVYDNTLIKEEWKLYKNAANEQLPQGYRLVQFLNVTLDKRLGMINSVSHNIINGQFLQPELVFNPLPVYEKNTEEYGFDVDSLYNEKNQRNILSSIFRQFNPEHILIKVQLAPYKDFLLDTWKLPSFTNLNTAAMWKQVHLQWIKIEEFVRKIARELKDLSIKTGAAQILKLSDDSLQLQPVFLDKNQKYPVTKYFWKQIRHRYQSIVIVMHNDPYTSDQGKICDEEKDSNWSVSNNNFETGLTYVCSLHQDNRAKLQAELKVSLSNLAILELEDKNA